MSIVDRIIAASQEAGFEVFLDRNLREATGWRLTRSLRPRRCAISGKDLWGKKCYRGSREINWYGPPITQYYWIEKNEYLIWLLKG